MDLTILHEDNHIIVCLKPPGVLSQSGELGIPNMVDLLKDYLKEKYNKPGDAYLGLVHRLDLNVGGVMVFAKTSKAANRIGEQIKSHCFRKKYLAIAEGVFEDTTGTYFDYIIKDEAKRQAFISDKNSGKSAELRYRVIEQTIITNKPYSLLEINLITGRYHQIRFQLAHHLHPLYGDTKYGNHPENRDYFIGLYAYKLEFTHPVTKEHMTFIHKPAESRFKNFKEIENL